jgi:DNA-binding NarL/FixJ family response regulator
MQHTRFEPDETAEGILSARVPRGSMRVTPGRGGRVRLLVVVDPRYLERESFVRYLSMTRPEGQVSVIGVSSVEEWQSEGGAVDRDATLLFNIGSRDLSDADCSAEVRAAVEKVKPTPLVVLGKSEEMRDVIAAFDCGAQGYLSTSVGIDDIVEAARLVGSGGIFLPRSCVSVLRDIFSVKPARDTKPSASEVFTGRQLQVCNELRRGKSNKVIAFDLSLCESTVKVHIRNIMKKLNATNRTQAAFKLNSLYFSQDKEADQARRI